MRRRLALLFVLTSAAAGCSLLVDFDRGKIPALEEGDAQPDGATTDGSTDAPHTDSGGGDVVVTDAPVTDAPVTDAPVSDAPVTDAPTTDATDGGDGGTPDANDGATPDANDGATPDANDGAAPDASDASDAADAADDADAAVTSQYCSSADFDANDFSADGGTTTIAFPTGFTPAQYTPNCIRIKAGTTVTWSGDFSAHPLTRAGGSPSSPIPVSTNAANDGGSTGDVDITFPNEGIYDFKCGNHPLQMNGSVEVVP